MYYATISLYVQTFIMVCRINKSENLLQTKPNIRTTYETKLEKSGNGSRDLLKNLLEGNNNLSFRKPQNKNSTAALV